MALTFPTFSNDRGGDALFKALGHPLAVERAEALLTELRNRKRVAVFDPLGQFDVFRQFHALRGVSIAARFVQRLDGLGESGGAGESWPTLMVPEIGRPDIDAILIAAFDQANHLRSLAPHITRGIPVYSFDRLRLPPALLSNPRDYLAPINFSTNFVLFRADDRRRTVLRTVEYWTRYGAVAPGLWCRLFDADGTTLAEWTERLSPDQSIRIAADEVRARFRLGPFVGSLFVHAHGIAGHDVMKYVLDDADMDGADPIVTHDANSWPADHYAGFPAPAPGQRVVCWVQNAHPCPIPAGTLTFNRMGRGEACSVAEAVPGFGTRAVDLGALFPDLAWPDQIELSAGRHLVRPRYEIEHANTTRTLAHANVERTDLAPDPRIKTLVGAALGVGWILPAPILPTDDFVTLALPTPMATRQRDIPLAVQIYDPDGQLILREPLGRLPRDHRTLVEVSRLLAESGGGVDRGHVELVYDFADGGEADGWLHGLFRYSHRGGQVADTSFGSHVFNTSLVYKGEPQSYHGRPPGLTTRLALRLADAPAETWCCLIYPASTAWWPRSSTVLILQDAAGRTIAETRLAIPMSGSRLWQATDVFSSAELAEAGPIGNIAIVDRTCRLFGYHAVRTPGGGFALDHMFGF